EDGRGRHGREDRREPQAPAWILAERVVPRGHVQDPARDEGTASLEGDLRRRELPHAEDVRREGDAEQRDRRVAELSRAVRRERRERDDPERDHGRADQMRSATMRTVASQMPACRSKSAKPREVTVTARSSERNAPMPAGTGSAAQTNLWSGVASGLTSGSSGRTVRATTTSSVATTAPTPMTRTPATGCAAPTTIAR